MKKLMLRLLPLLLAAVLLLSACGQPRVKNDVPVSEIAGEVLEKLSAREDLTAMNEAYVTGMMGLEPADYADYAVYVSALGTNIDEFGVFKTAEGFSAQDAAQQLEDYLQMRRDTFMKEYTPEEQPKLEKAQVKTLGNYVIYAILSEAERQAAFREFEDELSD